jgi:hypothetical protein
VLVILWLAGISFFCYWWLAGVAAAAANLSMRHSCVQGRRYVAAIYHRLKRGEYHTDQLKGNYLKKPEDHVEE